jgi:hypothetical protein
MIIKVLAEMTKKKNGTKRRHEVYKCNRLQAKTDGESSNPQ